jgi:Zn-finger nucleic acid-binding protein
MHSSSDEYLAKVKHSLCRHCPLSLVCMMSEPFRTTEMYWCKKCQGWWFPENDLLIRCTELRVGPARMVPVGPRAQHRQIHIRKMQPSVDDCPNCNSKGEDPLTVFEGYNEAHEA